ncbi:hypothetical protein [Paenibacillus alkalitolerans]|uniref:hypothetical protein n=1 Tax=Paenibacillus alkalitolerans TaxID=2799335 RepID=UPI0018F5E25C|nr:hypothetical protein [Paenibacillus alkalitolerans]
MRIEGKHKCNSAYNECNHEYEWMVIIPQHINSSTLQVEKIDKVQGRIIEKSENKCIIRTICPNCHQDNVFEYLN